MKAASHRMLDSCMGDTSCDTELIEFVDSLPLLPPSEIAHDLECCGYHGQKGPKAAMSLAVYRHIRRLKQIYVHRKARSTLTPKQNVLMVGPTGCGKTHMVQLLFQQLYGLPVLIVDSTNYTEKGYVGRDIESILIRLIAIANGDTLLASCGVICLDEFDKLAGSSSNARFAGAGTTKDISGYGVQRELLTLIEGSDVDVQLEYGSGRYGNHALLSTRDIPFIACGAFSGMEMEDLGGKRIGFGTEEDVQEEAVSEVACFQKYGFIPELIGRFTRIVHFSPLDKQTLTTILLENVVPQYQYEFAEEGLELAVSDDALNHIVDQSILRGTGARGLHAELAKVIEEAAFQTFMRHREMQLTITVENGQLMCVFPEHPQSALAG